MARRPRRRKKSGTTTFEKEFRTCSLRSKESHVKGSCDLCGKALPRNKDGSIHKSRRWCSPKCKNFVLRNHLWAWARKEALRLGKRKCKTCGSIKQLEVHHVVPLVGKGYQASCFHHVSNLELQCKSCHQEITKSQIQERKKK